MKRRIYIQLSMHNFQLCGFYEATWKHYKIIKSLQICGPLIIICFSDFLWNVAPHLPLPSPPHLLTLPLPTRLCVHQGAQHIVHVDKSTWAYERTLKTCKCRKINSRRGNKFSIHLAVYIDTHQFNMKSLLLLEADEAQKVHIVTKDSLGKYF